MSALLEALVIDGTVTLIALAVLGAELVGLVALARRGQPASDLIANALSGVFLILALRSALLQSGPVAVAGFLGAAFIAHVVGIVTRLRRRASSS